MLLRTLITMAAGAFLAWLITFAVYESTKPITLPPAPPIQSVSPAPARTPEPPAARAEPRRIAPARSDENPLVGVWLESGTNEAVYRIAALPFSDAPVVAPAPAADVLIGPAAYENRRLTFAQTLRLKDAEGNVLAVVVVEAEAQIDPRDEDALLVTLRQSGASRAHVIRLTRDRSARADASEPGAT